VGDPQNRKNDWRLTKMRSALITGVTGQDGSYLAELLLAEGYRVVGTTRSVAQASLSLPPTLAGRVELVEWDISNGQQIEEVVAALRPDEFYNFAAYSSGAGMFDNPTGIGDVNGLLVVRILEAIKAVGGGIRFCQASSSEMFGEPAHTPQSEQTPFNPRSPYGAAKLYAHLMIQIYRQRYGLYACSAILFNHESPRRGLNFVTRKITSTAAKIKFGLTNELRLGNLEACRDWGFSRDYARAMWLMVRASAPEDYVIATGVTHSVREFCEMAFGLLDLDYRDYVIEDTAVYRPTEGRQLVGNPARARKNLGWSPDTRFADLVKMMVDADLHAYSK
jgi:GDPmannose 4,6-dehydratase